MLEKKPARSKKPIQRRKKPTRCNGQGGDPSARIHQGVGPARPDDPSVG
jgi:hypothetical protein